MKHKTAMDVIEALIRARKKKDYETALSCYEKNATVVLQPGQNGAGDEVIRAFILQVSSLTLAFEGHQIIESGGIALHLSRYTLDMGDKGIIHGRTADVLRKQADGTWLIAIDNAWAGND